MIGRLAFVTLVILSVALPAFAQAELQRRVDDNGVIYYRSLTAQDATAAAQPQRRAREPASPTAVAPAAPVKMTRKPPAGNTAKQRAKAQASEQARQQKQCARLQAKLDKVQQQLDDGYKEPRGNTLRRERRELKSQLFRECD